MAAAGGPALSRCAEATCSVCQDYFMDPVTIPECGHNFCRSCLERAWVNLEAVAFCPQCKKSVLRRSLICNQQLANMVEMAKKFNAHLGEGKFCEMHRETLNLFCREHGTPICGVCFISKEHENHCVIPLAEAASEYKEEICCRLQFLRKEQETILASQAVLEKESQELLKVTEYEKQKTVEKFIQLRHFQEEQLNEMEEAKKEIARRRGEQLARLSRKHSSLESIIQEMEVKLQKPASELMQDVRSTLQRYENRGSLGTPCAFPPQLKEKVSSFCIINLIIEKAMEQCKGSPLFRQLLQRANVTLDPDTAHPELILSEDRKSVRRGDKEQVLPYNPARFSGQPCVLGCEGFVTGSHFWEVNVGNGEFWAVGVAKESVERKGFSFSPEKGIWAVEKLNGNYWACTSPHYSLLSPREKPRRIRVTLDHEGGLVSFSDVDSGTQLYTFSVTSFSGETLLPFFALSGSQTHLRLS